MEKEKKRDCLKNIIDISDGDILEAMRNIEGYIDITLSDFKELYRFACNHASERLLHDVTAGDIMTKQVVSVSGDARWLNVAETMATHGISGVPVTGPGGEVIGVISDKDFLRHMGTREPKSCMALIAQCLGSKGCVAIPTGEMKAEALMTSPAITVTEQTPVSAIMHLFAEKKINRVPVLNPQRALSGIVSRADLLYMPFWKAKDRG